MDPLADLALRFPDVVLVLAHAAIADQGMFASTLRDHPNVVYDTSTFSVFDQLDLFARVSAERIVFASDVPYGQPLARSTPRCEWACTPASTRTKSSAWSVPR